MTVRRGIQVAAMTAVMAVAAAACGSDDGTVVGPTSTSAPSTSGATTSTSPSAPDPDCSAADLPPVAAQAGLPEPVASMREALADAAISCDYGTLAGYAAAGGDEFTFTFGDTGEPSAHWQELEAQDDEPLRSLVELLRAPHAMRPVEGGEQFVWPSAYGYESWDAVPADDRAALEAVYDDEDLERFSQAGAYLGYRIGITDDGDWQFFVAGD